MPRLGWSKGALFLMQHVEKHQMSRSHPLRCRVVVRINKVSRGGSKSLEGDREGHPSF